MISINGKVFGDIYKIENVMSDSYLPILRGHYHIDFFPITDNKYEFISNIRLGSKYRLYPRYWNILF
jgi:hypothetical protein